MPNCFEGLIRLVSEDWKRPTSLNQVIGSLHVQADALEHALIAALPLGPQSAAGGISLPDSFHGELQVF